MTEQCALLGLPRSSWYYQPVTPSATTQELLDRLDDALRVAGREVFGYNRSIDDDEAITRAKILVEAAYGEMFDMLATIGIEREIESGAVTVSLQAPSTSRTYRVQLEEHEGLAMCAKIGYTSG